MSKRPTAASTEAAPRAKTDPAMASRQASTFRLGGKAVVATSALATKQWATEQGTLLTIRGGSGICPTTRLANLCADEAADLPIAALADGALRTAFRTRRASASTPQFVADAEWTALAVAVEDYLRINLPRLRNPFASTDTTGTVVLSQIEFTAALQAVGAMAKAGTCPPGLKGALLGAMPTANAALLRGVADLGKALDIKGPLSLNSLFMSYWASRLRDGDHLDQILADAAQAAASTPKSSGLRAA